MIKLPKVGVVSSPGSMPFILIIFFVRLGIRDNELSFSKLTDEPVSTRSDKGRSANSVFMMICGKYLFSVLL